MTPERWAQIEELFHRAAECGPEQRTVLLDKACGDDGELRREIEVLLSSDGRAGDRVQAAVRTELDAVGFPLTGETISHYRILGGLGAGGMGSVYQAEDIKLGRRVALKFLPEESAKDPAALGRFEREARSASALEHPNICPIYEFGEHEGQPFLVMQLLEGQTLRELISAAGAEKAPLELGRLLDLATQIVDGLDAAHRHGIIHRDIKPANIFVTREGQAKILDFGLAKLARGESPSGSDSEPAHGGNGGAEGTPRETATRATPDLFLSRTGVEMGTAGYMSPEQVRGEKLDARTDLFSFGLVLYEMGAGKRAFKGDSGPVLQEAILKQTPSPARGVNPEIPAKLEKIVSKLLEKNREARYPAASDVRADLEALKREMAPKHLVRRWAVGGVAALIISGTVFWFARRQPTSSAPPDLKLRQLTTNSSENRVISGAISPDGKYLAYTDYLGVHLKLIETGEIRTIPPPEALKDRTLEWEFACWFPDSSRILATAHPPNSKTNPSYSSSGASIWVYPVVGGTPAKLRDDAMGWSVSPDGTLVSFTTNPGRFGDGESWLMQLDGKGAQKQLETDENSAITGFGWSPDAQRVLYSRYDGSKDHWVSRKLKGGPVTPVFPPSETREINDLGVLPDGRLIYSLEESRAGAAARAL